MMKSHGLSVLFLCVIFSPVGAESPAGKTIPQKILDQTQDALVTFKVNVQAKLEVGGKQVGKGETTLETSATTVGPNGLTIVPLEATRKETEQDDDDDQKSTRKTFEFSNFRLLLNKREVPARVVLRDEDLGLALVIPVKTKDIKTPYVEITKGTEPALLDELIVPHRFNKAHDQQAGLDSIRVRAVLRKPRTYFVPSGGTGALNGCPVFDRSGQLVGIMATRVNAGMRAPVIVPASDVADLVKQATASVNGKQTP